MSMRIAIDDHSNELSITVHASGSYAPDVLNDVMARALATYKDALTARWAVGVAFDTVGEPDDGA